MWMFVILNKYHKEKFSIAHTMLWPKYAHMIKNFVGKVVVNMKNTARRQIAIFGSTLGQLVSYCTTFTIISNLIE